MRERKKECVYERKKRRVCLRERKKECVYERERERESERERARERERYSVLQCMHIQLFIFTSFLQSEIRYTISFDVEVILYIIVHKFARSH